MDEICTATYTPVVSGLEEIEVLTGEEDQDLVYSHLCLLYRFDSDAQMWKGRGRGDVKLLKHQDTGACRLVLREDKTFKLRLNAPISEEVELRFQGDSDKAFMWVCTDYSEGNEGGVQETVAVKFKTPEIANDFKTAYDKARSGEACATSEPASAAAPKGTPMTTDEAKAFVAAVVEAKEDPKSVLDTYVAKHGLNTLSKDGFTLLMYVVGVTGNQAAAEMLLKTPGIKLDVVSTGQVYNFEWDEKYVLHGLHNAEFNDELESFDTGMTAMHFTALSALKPLFILMWESKCNKKIRTKKGKDLRDCIKARYDSDGGKHDLTKLITPKKAAPKPVQIINPLSAKAPEPKTEDKKESAAKADEPATGAAGFKFSSTPSFNFSWGKAAEEKKAADDAVAMGAMTTDVKQLQTELLAEKTRADKAEQMLEEALVELKSIKQERKGLQEENKKVNMTLSTLLQQMGLEGGEGDEGDGMYGEIDEGDDLE